MGDAHSEISITICECIEGSNCMPPVSFIAALARCLFFVFITFSYSTCLAEDFSNLADTYTPRCGSNYEDGTVTDKSEYFKFEHVANKTDANTALNQYWSRVSKRFAEFEVQHCDEEFFVRAGASGLNSICPLRCSVLEKFSCEMIPKNPAKRTLDYIDAKCEIIHPSSPQSPGIARCFITIQFDIFYRCVHPSIAEGPTRLDREALSGVSD